jgi:SPP1 gp7 family putative phage head morphogenesis protein
MPDLYDLVQEQREVVLSRDRAASADLVRAYSTVARSIREEIDEILSRINRAKKGEQVIRPSWLDSELRLSSILRELRGKMSGYAESAAGILESDIEDAARMGDEHTAELVRQQITVGFRRLNESALQSIVQFTNKGALRDLLDSFGPDLSKRLRALLVASITTGRSPNVTARLIRDAIGVPLTRSITIARTESMRAYREAAHRSLSENTRTVKGWYWYAKLARNTCPACWAMHGTKHKVDERLPGHPRCRCSMVPFTKSWSELGFPGIDDTAIDPPTPGKERFERLKDSTKEAILGPTRFQAYQDGTSLDEMMYRRRSKKWGPSIAVRPLSSM